MKAKSYLGLDISLTKTGWAVLTVSPEGHVQITDYGLIKSNPKLSDGERLRQIYDGVADVIDRFPIQSQIIREGGIVRFNLPTKQIFKAHGVIEYVLVDFEILDVNIATVKAWARRVTGSAGRRNDKDMIAEAVRLYYGNPELKLNKEGDEADAIAVATTFLIQNKLAAEGVTV